MRSVLRNAPPVVNPEAKKEAGMPSTMSADESTTLQDHGRHGVAVNVAMPVELSTAAERTEGASVARIGWRPHPSYSLGPIRTRQSGPKSTKSMNQNRSRYRGGSRLSVSQPSGQVKTPAWA